MCTIRRVPEVDCRAPAAEPHIDRSEAQQQAKLYFIILYYCIFLLYCYTTTLLNIEVDCQAPAAEPHIDRCARQQQVSSFDATGIY